MSAITRMRILVIEDDADTAYSLKLLLQSAGYEASTAGDGVAGLLAARAILPDVVLCDIAMPRMDGRAVARALRSEPSLARTRLIAMSGSGLDDEVEQCRRAGFDDHLLKPAEWERVRQVLESR